MLLLPKAGFRETVGFIEQQLSVSQVPLARYFICVNSFIMWMICVCHALYCIVHRSATSFVRNASMWSPEMFALDRIGDRDEIKLDTPLFALGKCFHQRRINYLYMTFTNKLSNHITLLVVIRLLVRLLHYIIYVNVNVMYEPIRGLWLCCQRHR